MDSSNSNEVNKIQLIEQEDIPGASLELLLNYENHFRHSSIPDEIMDTLYRNEDAEHIRIISTDNYEDLSSQHAKLGRHESDFLFYLKKVVLCIMGNLRTLYLESYSELAVYYCEIDYLSVHPTLEEVTVVNRINRDVSHKMDIRVKQVGCERNLVFHGINLYSEVWSYLIPHRLKRMKNVEEIDLVVNSPVSQISFLLPYASFLKSLRMVGFTISKEDFNFICLNCRKLDTLVVHVQDKIFFSDFCSVKRLDNLRVLVLKMEYDFSRQVLTRILKQSDFSQLNVVIIELQREESPEFVTLKNGLITVKFLGNYGSYYRNGSTRR